MPETNASPGTREAIAAGCRCPVMDNGHGWGYGTKGQFIYNEACDYHAETVAALKRVREAPDD